MALIPSDVGLRLRLDNNELQPQSTRPVGPIKEVTADLPRLIAGQQFTAQIRDVLPQNTYLALVAGKQVTLSLPASVQAGDVLELEVVEQTAQAVVAKLLNPETAGKLADLPNTRFSQTAQMLRNLLLPEGEQPQAAPLNRGQPILSQPPQNGAELAKALSQAVKQSGLFYEAHQAQWVAGKLPLAQLRTEPQGRQPAPLKPSLTSAANAEDADISAETSAKSSAEAPAGTTAKTSTQSSASAALNLRDANLAAATTQTRAPAALAENADVSASSTQTAEEAETTQTSRNPAESGKPLPTTSTSAAETAKAGTGAATAEPAKIAAENEANPATSSAAKTTASANTAAGNTANSAANNATSSAANNATNPTVQTPTVQTPAAPTTPATPAPSAAPAPSATPSQASAQPSPQANTQTNTQANTPPPQAMPPGAQQTPPLNNATAQNLSLYQANQALKLTADSAPPGTNTATSAPAAPTALGPNTANSANVTTATPGNTAQTASSATNPATQPAANPAPLTPAHTVPTVLSDEVRALVQQQLDAAGSQRLFWHGEVWPEQDVHWQVEWQPDENAAGAAEEAEPWQTSLRLTTPRLGQLDAALQLGPAGVRINLQALDAASVKEMRAAAGKLVDAFAAAGLPLRGFTIRQSAEAAPPSSFDPAPDSHANAASGSSPVKTALELAPDTPEAAS